MVDSPSLQPEKADPREALSIRVAGKIGGLPAVGHRRLGTTCGMRLMIIPILPATLHGGICSAVP
jgi:hypothetical protein